MTDRPTAAPPHFPYRHRCMDGQFHDEQREHYVWLQREWTEFCRAEREFERRKAG